MSLYTVVIIVKFIKPPYFESKRGFYSDVMVWAASENQHIWEQTNIYNFPRHYKTQMCLFFKLISVAESANVSSDSVWVIFYFFLSNSYNKPLINVPREGLSFCTHLFLF
jgi:hypothetical protein